MVNIYDTANQLAEDLTKIDQYQTLAKAIKTVEADQESNAMFQKMDELQTKILKAQQNGTTLSKEDQQAYQDLSAKVQKNAKIVALLKAEQDMYNVIGDVQKTFTKPINDLYGDLRK